MKRIPLILLIIGVLVQAPRILRYAEARQRASEQQQRELRYERSKETETKQDDCVNHLENMIIIWDGLVESGEEDIAQGLYDAIPKICDGWQHNDPHAKRLLAELDALVK